MALLKIGKMTDFSKIPRFTRSGAWECDYHLERAVRFVQEAQKEEKLDLDPDFQRGHVWNEGQQIAWLEFLLRGGVTGRVIYFNNPNWQNNRHIPDDYVIVDGKQRLHAITRFINNEIRVFGSYYNEYINKPDVTIKLHVNDLPTRAEVLQWYIEFNSGGVLHSHKEIARVKRLLAKELKAKK